MSTTDELKAMHWPIENPKFIFFTDFDGTITLQDSNDFMVWQMALAIESVVDRHARQTI